MTMERAPVLQQHNLRDAWILLILCVSTLLLSQWMVPSIQSAKQRLNFQIDQMIPASFGHWHPDPTASYQVVDPQREAVLKQLYQQTLSRTYVDNAGHAVMLSIAYGEQQLGSYQAHLPDICYPAQGFRVLSKHYANLDVGGTGLPVTRLETVFNDMRYEDVTYWLTVGDRVVPSIGYGRRIEQVKYALKREIPDGIIFRISSIGRNPAEEFARQDSFVHELLNAVSPGARTQLAGLPQALHP
jgi:EpsI family protein